MDEFMAVGADPGFPPKGKPGPKPLGKRKRLPLYAKVAPASIAVLDSMKRENRGRAVDALVVDYKRIRYLMKNVKPKDLRRTK